MRTFIEKVISSLKKTEYHIDSNISTCQLVGVVFERSRMALRGVVSPVRKNGFPVFIGRHVAVKSPRKMLLGKAVTIHDNCFIQAMSKGGIQIGDNSSIGRSSVIDCTGVITELGESLVIGKNVGISPRFMAFVRGPVFIGDDTIIGPNVTLISENHNSSDVDTPIRKQGTSRKGIMIGKNCWIGANVSILDGVTIGDGAVVAAGAVVTKDVAAMSVVGGVPSKVLKMRTLTEAPK